MTAAPALSWPPTRALLGWWRQLAGRQPRQLWFSRLLLHRLEALVEVKRFQPLDALQRALLRHAASTQPFTDLHLDPQVLTQLLRELAGWRLLEPINNVGWSVTDAGRQALESGTWPRHTEERRSFYFVDNTPIQRPPHYLFLPNPGQTAPAPAEANCSFDPAVLQECLQQTAEWKTRHRFPPEVTAVLLPAAQGTPAENCRRVLLDRLEQLAVALIDISANGRSELLGFPVRLDGWVLATEPVLVLGEGWPEVFPDLVEEPPTAAWQQAWRTWCQPRSLPPLEVDACRLERCDHRLRVLAPQRLIDRLRAARSDAIKQETWLLAGTGRTRTAAQVELHSL
jgi:hypothetical protein